MVEKNRDSKRRSLGGIDLRFGFSGEFAMPPNLTAVSARDRLPVRTVKSHDRVTYSLTRPPTWAHRRHPSAPTNNDPYLIRQGQAVIRVTAVCFITPDCALLNSILAAQNRNKPTEIAPCHKQRPSARRRKKVQDMRTSVCSEERSERLRVLRTRCVLIERSRSRISRIIGAFIMLVFPNMLLDSLGSLNALQ